MNFIKGAVKTIGNAIELDRLKSDRETLRAQKKDIEDKLTSYDKKAEVLSNYKKVIEKNEETLAFFRSLFFAYSVNEGHTIEEMVTANHEPHLIESKKAFDIIKASNAHMIQACTYLSPQLSKSKDEHLAEIAVLDVKIEKINDKLKQIRNKDPK